jgi:hypothetical protein
MEFCRLNEALHRKMIAVNDASFAPQEIARLRKEGESGLISAKLLFCTQYRLSSMYFL